jgi:hypothetical protein
MYYSSKISFTSMNMVKTLILRSDHDRFVLTLLLTFDLLVATQHLANQLPSQSVTQGTRIKCTQLNPIMTVSCLTGLRYVLHIWLTTGCIHHSSPLSTPLCLSTRLAPSCQRRSRVLSFTRRRHHRWLRRSQKCS